MPRENLLDVCEIEQVLRYAVLFWTAEGSTNPTKNLELIESIALVGASSTQLDEQILALLNRGRICAVLNVSETLTLLENYRIG